MKINYISKITQWSLLLFVLSLGACKKDKTPEEPKVDECGNTKQTPTTDRVALTNDSIFLYAKAIYYWNEELPCYDQFEPRQYTSGSPNLAKYESNLLAIAQATENQYDVLTYEGVDYTKFSYIEDRQTINPEATAVESGTLSVDLSDNGYDIGIRPVFYLLENDDSGSYFLFVTAVYKNSSADINGVKRGWVITKINGEQIGENYSSESSKVINALNSSSVHLEGVNYDDQKPFDVILMSKSYKSSPIYDARVLNIENKKIGYLAYARFSNQSEDVLDSIFNVFSTNKISDLIVDLRYNGGGYVSTAEHMINLIAPSSLNNKVMFSEHYNTMMQSGKADILENQPDRDDEDNIVYYRGKMQTLADYDYSVEGNTVNFTKNIDDPSNNISKVIFIVSDNTASASELVINTLKPYMSINLVGTTTYGKPVGFFPIRLENRYDVYLSLFSTKNSNDQGDYYNGMVPDVDDDFDDPRYEFGDVRENYLELAINEIIPGYIKEETVSTQSNKMMNVKGKQKSLSSFKSVDIRPLKKNFEFRGMIETKLRTRKNVD